MNALSGLELQWWSRGSRTSRSSIRVGDLMNHRGRETIRDIKLLLKKCPGASAEPAK
jgi:hypothetical protein